MDLFILCGLIDEHTLGQKFFESNSAEEYMTQFHVCLQLLPLHTYQKAYFVIRRRGKFCNCYFLLKKSRVSPKVMLKVMVTGAAFCPTELFFDYKSFCRPLTWISERVRGGKPRQASQEYKFEDGTTVTPAPVSKPSGPPPPGHKGLFARDLEIFLSEVRGERSSDEIAQDKKRVLYCLELAEKIETMAKTGTCS